VRKLRTATLANKLGIGESQKERAMERRYFNKPEARKKIGNIVEALSDFPSVPKGSRGTVVNVSPYTNDK
jgi:hypothetical protein